VEVPLTSLLGVHYVMCCRMKGRVAQVLGCADWIWVFWLAGEGP
jgi:hypothetical protein